MVLSPALNIRSARGPIYDADALAFCRASGATARKAISDFVKGVKRLGLWNNMVCWPLRSSQNAGTGTTAYSLGGLGTFNGTLVNGPTWGSEGIDFVRASSTFVDVPHSTALQGSGSFSLLLATRLDDTVSRQWIFAKDASFQRDYGIAANNASGIVSFYPNTNTLATVTMGAPQSSVWKFLAGRYTPTTGRASRDGGAEASATIAAPTVGTAALRIGARQFATVEDYFDGKVAFAAFVAADIGDKPVYSLYKQTLGQGLGLP